MEKLLSITSENMLSGISPHPQRANKGLWQSAARMNPFITPGILKVQGAVTDLTGAVVVDIPTCSVADGTSLYFLGNGGRIYGIANVNTAPVVTEKKNTISNITNGIAIFQPNGGTKYLYYWQQGQIGRWDLSATFVDNQYTGLQTTTHHPVHKMYDEIYYGNKDRIGKLSDDAATGVAHSTNVLDFPTESVVTAISDDGVYLVAAVSKSTGSTSLYTNSKVIFWDKTSSSWNKEWTINDPIISAMQEKNGLIYAWGSRGVYVFNFSTAPQQIRNDIFALYGYPEQIGLYNDAVVLGQYTYGKVTPDVPTALFNHFGGQMTGNVTMVNTGASANFTFFGTSSSNLYYFTNNSAASGAISSLQWTTVYLPLKDRYQIGRIDVIRDIPLTSGERILLSVRTAQTVAQKDFNEMSYTNHGAKDHVVLYSDGAVECDNFSIEINPINGSTRIKQIDIYGTKVNA